MTQTRWAAIGIAGVILVVAIALVARMLRSNDRSVAVAWEAASDDREEHAA